MVHSPEEASPMLIHRASSTVCVDLHFGLAIRRQLDALLRELIPLTEESLIRLGAEGGGKVKDMLLAAAGSLKRISEFVTGTQDDDEEESWNVNTNAVRQTLLREQGVLSCIIDLVEQLFRLATHKGELADTHIASVSTSGPAKNRLLGKQLAQGKKESTWKSLQKAGE